MPRGYTLLETVVAIFVFCIGGLALASTSAVIGRRLNANASQERAARDDANSREIAMSQCAPRRLRC
ncbi:MAG TPA: prepilin-type N-terminal cleavage/methylation domain-containing protein [Gemmatimonadaceae bacterium]|nr:prepilin-type N-terminal cleavage/methylation domain-containing protein [Gemmatimonadaceae bacterium]